MKVIYVLLMMIPSSFLFAESPTFKFTFGSNIGNVPIEINNFKKNQKPLMGVGVKIDKWILSPNFSSLTSKNFSSKFSNNKSSKGLLYIKFNYKF